MKYLTAVEQLAEDQFVTDSMDTSDALKSDEQIREFSDCLRDLEPIFTDATDFLNETEEMNIMFADVICDQDTTKALIIPTTPQKLATQHAMAELEKIAVSLHTVPKAQMVKGMNNAASTNSDVTRFRSSYGNDCGVESSLQHDKSLFPTPSPSLASIDESENYEATDSETEETRRFPSLEQFAIEVKSEVIEKVMSEMKGKSHELSCTLEIFLELDLTDLVSSRRFHKSINPAKKTISSEVIQSLNNLLTGGYSFDKSYNAIIGQLKTKATILQNKENLNLNGVLDYEILVKPLETTSACRIAETRYPRWTKRNV